MYKDKAFERNGFSSHEEFVEMLVWLRNKKMTLQDIARLYGITKPYVQRLVTKSQHNTPPVEARAGTGTHTLRDTPEQDQELAGQEVQRL